jgi:hypothetical protein
MLVRVAAPPPLPLVVLVVAMVVQKKPRRRKRKKVRGLRNFGAGKSMDVLTMFLTEKEESDEDMGFGLFD